MLRPVTPPGPIAHMVGGWIAVLDGAPPGEIGSAPNAHRMFIREFVARPALIFSGMPATSVSNDVLT